MRPPLGQPPIELSPAEHAIIKRIRRAKLFVFLRHIVTRYLTTPFSKNWRRSIGIPLKAIRRFHPPHWRWPRCSKPIAGCLMTR
jgi:hypothetical protein